MNNNFNNLKSTPLVRNNNQQMQQNQHNNMYQVQQNNNQNRKIENFPSAIQLPNQNNYIEKQDKKMKSLRHHLNYKKQNITNIFIVILTMLAAFGFHAVFMFIIKAYVKRKRIGTNMEFLTRLLYPVLIFFLIWLAISGFV